MTRPDATVRSACPSRARPVDLIHLARQTGGSRQLEGEVLTLMARHIVQALEWSITAERDAVPALAHGIAGAARNVGAFPLALSAAALEMRPGEPDVLAEFRAEAERVLRFIEGLEERGSALTRPVVPTTCAA